MEHNTTGGGSSMQAEAEAAARARALGGLREWAARAEKDATLVLQRLRWARAPLQDRQMVTCSIDKSHRVPASNILSHTKKCALRAQGYGEDDLFLPDIVDSGAAVKLNSLDVTQIIMNASKNDSSIKTGIARGVPDNRPLPLTAERLVATYTTDERRALHDAVVAKAPAMGESADLTLPGSDNKKTKPKSQLEVLAELRDMKRRRTKYKVATKSKKYSEVLREVIKSQMELYTGVKEEPEIANSQSDIVRGESSTFNIAKDTDSSHIIIKQERSSNPRELDMPDRSDFREKHRNDGRKTHRDNYDRGYKEKSHERRKHKHHSHDREHLRDRERLRDRDCPRDKDHPHNRDRIHGRDHTHDREHLHDRDYKKRIDRSYERHRDKSKVRSTGEKYTKNSSHHKEYYEKSRAIKIEEIELPESNKSSVHDDADREYRHRHERRDRNDYK